MSSPKNKRTKRIVILCAARLAVVVGLFWFLIGHIADVGHVFDAWLLNTVWRGWLFPNGWNIFGATPFFWMIVAGAVVAFMLWQVIGRQYAKQLAVHEAHVKRQEKLDKRREHSEDTYQSAFSYRTREFEFNPSMPTPAWFKRSAVVVGVAWLAFAVFATVMWGDWNGRHYNAASTYVIQDSDNVPNSLHRIRDAKKPQVTIETGVMPDAWEKRVASATGATYVLQKTGDSNANTELLTETVSYIYDTEGDGGSWTGIRNGTKRQPLYGITSWAGTGETVKSCEFKGDHELNKAFGSSWGMNLNDDIAQFDASFRFDLQDAYGFCDGDKPVIVIPGTKVTGLQVQTANTSYGVMVITGSPSGQPNIELRTTVKPGELPGPVYPIKLVEAQRDTLSWSAGRVWPMQTPVGFEATSSPSQSGNSTDFLLKSKDDGRLYWTTPMKHRHTDSQTIVAYAMVPADEMTQGSLNEQRIYVLNDNDTRVVNFNDLANAVTQAVAKVDPGFFTGGEDNQGRIVEFIPTGGGSW